MLGTLLKKELLHRSNALVLTSQMPLNRSAMKHLLLQTVLCLALLQFGSAQQMNHFLRESELEESPHGIEGSRVSAPIDRLAELSLEDAIKGDAYS